MIDVKLNIHGGMDWISIPHSYHELSFQQEVDGLRIITAKNVCLLRQNMSCALTIPAHLSIAKQFKQYPSFFIQIYRRYENGDEGCVNEYQSISPELMMEVIQELLKVSCSHHYSSNSIVNGTTSVLRTQNCYLLFVLQFVSFLPNQRCNRYVTFSTSLVAISKCYSISVKFDSPSGLRCRKECHLQ